MTELDEIRKARRYDSMGFQNEHGMWVRWADFDRLLALVEQMGRERDALKLFDAAVTAELPRVSHLEYDSHDICEHFATKLRARIAEQRRDSAQVTP